MEYRCIKVTNDVGLHARPAALFVKEVGLFKSDIRIRNATTDSDWADAKSILSVLTLGVEKGHEIEITAEGSDEIQAATALEKLIRTDLADEL
jgi:phosphocarrier protein HPr